MPLPKENIYTTEDIYALPEGQRAELIDGQLYMMAPPNRIHQELVMQLSSKIHNHITNSVNTAFTGAYSMAFSR